VTWGDSDEYVYVKLYNIYYYRDEVEEEVMVSTDWGPSRLLTTDDDGNEAYKTIEEIIDDADMGEWSNIDEMVDDIKEKVNKIVYNNCGFGTWFQ